MLLYKQGFISKYFLLLFDFLKSYAIIENATIRRLSLAFSWLEQLDLISGFHGSNSVRGYLFQIKGMFVIPFFLFFKFHYAKVMVYLFYLGDIFIWYIIIAPTERSVPDYHYIFSHKEAKYEQNIASKDQLRF